MKIHGSKGIIDLDVIEPVDIELTSIAASLSRQARFNGNGSSKISVAQHCIVGATALAGGTGNYLAALWFLLHDAHEAYTGDIITPMKNEIVDLGGGDPIGDMQDRIDDAISRQLFFDFDFGNVKSMSWYQSVKDLDKFLAKYEASKLFSYVEKPQSSKSNPTFNIAECVYNGEEISRALTVLNTIPVYVRELAWFQKANLVLKHQSLRERILNSEAGIAELYIDLYFALYSAASIQRVEEQ